MNFVSKEDFLPFLVDLLSKNTQSNIQQKFRTRKNANKMQRNNNDQNQYELHIRKATGEQQNRADIQYPASRSARPTRQSGQLFSQQITRRRQSWRRGNTHDTLQTEPSLPRVRHPLHLPSAVHPAMRSVHPMRSIRLARPMRPIRRRG